MAVLSSSIWCKTKKTVGPIEFDEETTRKNVDIVLMTTDHIFAFVANFSDLVPAKC